MDFLEIFLKENNLYSEEKITKLQKFVEIVLRENKKLNLIGKSTIEDIWQRHILDSAQLASYIKNDTKIVDFGSGSGMPAIVLGIILDKSQILMVEKSIKKAIFLNTAINELKLLDRMLVLNENINLAPNVIKDFNPDCVTARAFKPLNEFMNILKICGILDRRIVLLKGRNFKNEINDLKNQVKYGIYKSIIDPEGVVVIIN